MVYGLALNYLKFHDIHVLAITLIVTQEELPGLIDAIQASGEGSSLYHSEVDGIVGRFSFRALR